MKPIPDDLLGCAFTRAEAAHHGVTSRMLEGSRFTRVYPGVWRATNTLLTHRQLIAAAALALPDQAHLTGITRLQMLGLDYGPRSPLRFVVEGDLHLDLDGIFLHRTKRLAPHDIHGITPVGAFLSYCSLARAIDAIKVGDWLLYEGHATRQEILDLASSALWRAGAAEAVWVLDHLHTDSRSLKESETRAVLEFSGLEAPEVNVVLPLASEGDVIGDLFFRRWRTVVEYEGSHHQTERGQYRSDLDRYARLRAESISYVQVTHEKLATPRLVVSEVFRTLVANGYDGPPPQLNDHWRSLFARIGRTLGSRRDYLRRLAAS
ncbi:MAG: hypothetical protein WB767_05375 [Nocardioides sp.]